VEVPSGRVAQTRAALNRLYSRVFHRSRNQPKPLDIDSYAQFGEDVCIRHLLGTETEGMSTLVQAILFQVQIRMRSINLVGREFLLIRYFQM